MKIVFASYTNQPGYHSPREWIEKIKKFTALMEAFSKHCPVTYITHIGDEAHFTQNGVEYRFLFTAKKNKYRIPIRMNKAIKNMRPDIVIISGLRFPLQVLQLRWFLGKKVKLVARHHADKPPRGVKKVLQQLADRCINAYLFTSLGNAGDWINAGIIKNQRKIYELIAASADFSRMDTTESMKITGMKGKYNFLWVGRLNANKDPLTVISGFEKYLLVEPSAKLYMIFQEEDLLAEVKQRTGQNELLEPAVILVGYVPYELLVEWYSAADYFISGSHSEGGSFALLEAMACGCIPIVTSIPAALKVIEYGRYGIIFRPGDADDLANKLLGLSGINHNELSGSIENHFRKELSTNAIADKLYSYCKELLAK